MTCCTIIWGNVSPSAPPTAIQFPIYLDRTNREVWYWNGNYWELVWQLPIASDTTGGVRVSPTSPITIDADGYLGLNCSRLVAQCGLLDKATLDAALENFRSQFMAEITRIDRRIDSILTTIGTLVVRLTTMETTVGDFARRITTLETTVTDLSKRVTVIEGDITTIKGAITAINTRLTSITNGSSALAGDIAALKAKDIYLEDLIKHLNPRVDYAVEAQGSAVTSIGSYIVTWTVFGSPNSNIKKFCGTVCLAASTVASSSAGIEHVEFDITPKSGVISGYSGIGSFISAGTPSASMGFDPIVTANGKLGAMFKHTVGTTSGCQGHRIFIEYI